MEHIDLALDDHVATLTLNRPDKLNAINKVMRSELFDVLRQLRDDPEVWVIAITGSGRAFCAGRDIRDKTPGSMRAESVVDNIYLLQRHIYKPIVALINGPCVAMGTGLALLSDIRIMTRDAYFSWPQVKNGIASVSGPALLLEELPVAAAMPYLLTGDRMTAADALRLNLVTSVVADAEELVRTGQEWTRRLAESAPLAVQAIKEAAVRFSGMGFVEKMALGADLGNEVLRTDDAQEGIRAFAEKRSPHWTGK